MKYDPLKHHRRSIRLQDYDYTRAGAYFVTIVNQNRTCLFGEIDQNAMNLNPAGQMIEKWWLELSHKFPAVEIDAFTVMPNHFHGIVVIADHAEADVRTDVGAALRVGPAMNLLSPAKPVSLPAIVQWFKTMTTNEYIRGVKTSAWTPFPGKLWQRNYHEHIVRNEEDLAAIRRYIDNNPQQWALDDENPERQRLQP
jgi:REP element-mobilizing transposase RayT